MPNFLIIGTGRSGSTSVYYWLKQHPEIYMSPVKEPSFFVPKRKMFKKSGANTNVRQLVRETKRIRPKDLEAYSALFNGVTTEKAIGEASPTYLVTPGAAKRIKEQIPEAKLIAILRNPVERAHAHYLARRTKGFERLSFKEALKADQAGIPYSWGLPRKYIARGLYCTHLRRYYDLFDKDQIKVYLHEDLKKDPVGFAQDIYKFLGVDDKFIPNVSVMHSRTGLAKNKFLNIFLERWTPFRYILRRVSPHTPEWVMNFVAKARNKNLTKPSIPEEIRKQLIEIYREDILKLQELIQRDLSKWLE